MASWKLDLDVAEMNLLHLRWKVWICIVHRDSIWVFIFYGIYCQQYDAPWCVSENGDLGYEGWFRAPSHQVVLRLCGKYENQIINWAHPGWILRGANCSHRKYLKKKTWCTISKKKHCNVSIYKDNCDLELISHHILIKIRGVSPSFTWGYGGISILNQQLHRKLDRC